MAIAAFRVRLEVRDKADWCDFCGNEASIVLLAVGRGFAIGVSDASLLDAAYAPANARTSVVEEGIEPRLTVDTTRMFQTSFDKVRFSYAKCA